MIPLKNGRPQTDRPDTQPDAGPAVQDFALAGVDNM